ncbi:MAG: DUF697 domain-containing protein [Acidobacteriota bacterium]|nr:DUF697 domain-containing protein [Acidobacteriota bacterium]
MKIVWRYVAISSGAGLIQVPVLDVSALAGVHVALIKALADYYGVEFSHHTAKAILIAIGAGLVPGAIGSVLGRRALAAIPFLTPVGGLLTMSAFSAVVSWGLGRIFIRHFEAGGTLADFDVKHLHDMFAAA